MTTETPLEETPKPKLLGNMLIIGLVIFFGFLLNWTLSVWCGLAGKGGTLRWLALGATGLVLPLLYGYFTYRYTRNVAIWTAYHNFLRQPLQKTIHKVIQDSFLKVDKSLGGAQRVQDMEQQFEEAKKDLLQKLPAPLRLWAEEKLFKNLFTEGMKSFRPNKNEPPSSLSEPLSAFIFQQVEAKAGQYFAPSLSWLAWLLPINLGLGAYLLILIF
jgi:hypothetical protein